MAKSSKSHRASPVPSWASFFSPAEYGEFSRLLSAELSRRDLMRDPHDSGVIRARSGAGERRGGLVNLAQICRDSSRGDWPRLIAEFFESMQRAESNVDQFMAQLRDFDAIKDKIKIRLHPDTYLQHEHAPLLILKPIVEGIAALLVCDLGYVNTSVPADMPAIWGKSRDELFELGAANVRAGGRLEVLKGPSLGGPTVDMMASGSNYAATHLLWFEDYCEHAVGYGALVTVPNRHMIFFHKIRDKSVFEAVAPLRMVTDKAYEDGPGSISTHIYWWRPGKLQVLPTAKIGDRVVVAPGHEFEEMVFESMMQGN